VRTLLAWKKEYQGSEKKVICPEGLKDPTGGGLFSEQRPGALRNNRPLLIYQ